MPSMIAPATQPDMVESPPSLDFNLAAAHVEALTGSADSVMDWRCIHDTDAARPADARRGTLSDLWPWIDGMNTAGYGAFLNVSELDGHGRELANVLAVRAHVVDLDSLDAEQQRQAAAAWSPAPSFQVETSPGRFHIYWCLSERYADNERFTALQRRIAQQFNGDKAVVDPTRVLRLAGSYNRKREVPHLVRCEALGGYGQPLTVDQLEASLSHVTVEEGATGQRRDLGHPDLAAPSLDWLKRALELVDPDDLSRDEWIKLTAATKQAGWLLTDEATLRGIWDEWCARFTRGTGNDPAENNKQWRSIRKSQLGWSALVAHIPSLRAEIAFPNGLPPPPAGASATPLPVAANDDRRQTINASNLFEHVLAGDDEPLRWHIEGLIPEDGLIPIYGPPKQGKTFSAIDMGASVATDTPFHGRKVAYGTVFYICGEGFRAIKQRFKAWSAARGVSLEGAPLFRSRCAVQMLDESSASMLSEAVASLAAAHGPPRLIIIDTLARNFGPGDENSTVDISWFVGAIDRLKAQWAGCSVIIVHHSGLADTKRARGSSALLGAADAEFRVESNATGPALYCTAMKDAAPAHAMQFEFVEAARSVALEYVGEPSGKGERFLSPVRQKAFDAFNAVAVDDAADIELWRVAFYERHTLENRDSMKSAFRTARKRLVEDGYLVTNDSEQIYSLPPIPGKPPPR